jgi:GNAT superfamily N-acetyltransferase
MNVTPEEFIEDFHEKRRLAGLGDEHGVKVVLSAPGISQVISCDKIAVDPTLLGSGLGRRTLDLLVEMSDATGLALELIPHKLPGRPGMSDEELVGWYQRHGFIPSPCPDAARRMVRAPRAQQQSD